MEESYHITIDDGAPLPTEDDMRELAEELGIPYEDYLAALDKHLPFDELLEYIKSLQNR